MHDPASALCLLLGFSHTESGEEAADRRTGPNNCVGKRLAMMMLRLVISYTVFYFRLEFAPGEDGMAIYREVKNHVILKAGPLMLTLKRRT